MSFAIMWMDLEDNMLSEISQTKKDEYPVVTYMWNLKNKTDKCNKTDIENKLMDTSGEGQVRSGEWTGTN